MSINSNTNPQQFLNQSSTIAGNFGQVDTRSEQFTVLTDLLDEYRTVLDKDFEARMAAARDSAVSSVRGSLQEQIAELELTGEQQIQDLESRVKDLTAANKQSFGRVKHLEDQVSDLNAELAEARASHKQVIAKLTQANDTHLQEFTKELQGLRANLSELGIENDGLRTKNQDLLRQVGSLRFEAEASSSRAHAEIHRLSAKLAQAQADIRLLQANSLSNAKDLQDQNTELTAQVKALEAKLAAATAKLNQAKTETTVDKIKQYAPTLLAAAVGAAATLAFQYFA